MRRCVASTCPDSSLKRMYLPRRPTSVISELRSCRSKRGRETPGAMRLRLSSAATIRRPTTTEDKALTTCSTSGSSGINYLFDLFFDLLHQAIFARLDVQPQQWFGVGAADVEAPLRSLE